ncbi:MAG TPA: type II toxin-antitoxin system RelE/ParE family toxin [Humisphaera sp.]|nr:type II toxin-antitoxin system RelE/ParE family toxin [Humisphaera sp.]
MPKTEVLFYCEADQSVPVLDWLGELHRFDRRAYNKCRAAIGHLGQLGHELRRPTADLLRDGIYELRACVGRVNYRLLYFFHGRNVAVVAHGLTKEREIPKSDLETAIKRKKQFEANPRMHTYQE